MSRGIILAYVANCFVQSEPNLSMTGVMVEICLFFFPPIFFCSVVFLHVTGWLHCGFCSVIAAPISVITLIPLFDVFCFSTGNCARLRVAVVSCPGRIPSARTKNRPVALHLRLVYSLHSTHPTEFFFSPQFFPHYVFLPPTFFHLFRSSAASPWTYDCFRPGRAYWSSAI